MADDLTSKIFDKLDDLSREVKLLRSEVNKTSSDTTSLRLHMHTVEDNTKTMQVDLTDIKQDLRRLEILHEETDSIIQQIAEDISPVFEKTTALEQTTEKHSDQLTGHDRRLNFLEKTA